MDKNIEDLTGGSVRRRAREKVCKQISDQTLSHAEFEVLNRVKGKVKIPIVRQVWNRVWRQIRNQIDPL